MNLKKTIINTCIAASAVLYTSCDLDLVPLDYYGSGSYWKTVSQVESYMNGIHVDLRASNFNRQFLLGEARGGTNKSGTSSLITVSKRTTWMQTTLVFQTGTGHTAISSIATC